MKYTLLGFWPDGKKWWKVFETDPDDLAEAIGETLQREYIKNKWRDEDLEALTIVDVIEGKFFPALGELEVIPAIQWIRRGPRDWSPKRKK